MTTDQAAVNQPAHRSRAVGVLLFCIRIAIGINWLALGIFTIAAVIFACGVVPTALEVPVPLCAVHATADAAEAPHLLYVEGAATVFLGDSDPRAAMGFVLLLLLYFGCLQYGFYQVHGIVQTIGGGTPFAPEVPRRFMRLALLCFVGWPVNGVAALVLGRRVVGGLAQQGLQLEAVLPEKNLNWLLGGLFCLVLAGAFRAGQRLQAEQDLTV